MNRDKMLDAAEEVVLRDGIGRLTLDAVARQASLSKGGLMHHFPTKDALLDAMVRRKVEGWRDECEAAIGRQPPGPGRVLRAMIGLCLDDTDTCGDTECRRCFVLVAALVHDSKHVEPLREVHRSLAARVADDGLPPGVGEAVHLAMNGLWFDRMFELSRFSGEDLGKIRRALLGIVDAGGGGAKASGRARGGAGSRAGVAAPARKKSQPAASAARSSRKARR